MREFFTRSKQVLHGKDNKAQYCATMTRLFWTLIAVFPMPLVALLIAGPPELFERERMHAAQDVVANLGADQIDWTSQFGDGQRVFLAQLLPEKGIQYERFGISFEYDTTPEQPVLVAPTGFDTDLRYRLAEACWEIPDGQLTLMRRC